MDAPEPLNLDHVRQRIDQLTALLPMSMTRTDIVTWFMINYLAGVRDVITNPTEMLPADVLGDGVSDEVRHEIAALFTERISRLAATTQVGPSAPS